MEQEKGENIQITYKRRLVKICSMGVAHSIVVSMRQGGVRTLK